MDMKVYKKCRYQNIYKNIKNGNYIISINKPIKTSITKIDGKKIFNIDEAIKIRDNALIRQQKATEVLHKEDFDTLWNKYIDECKLIKKQAYNTILRKEKDYNKYLKNKITKPLNKTDKNFWANFIDNLNCSNKQKNEIMKNIKAFFNWSIANEYLLSNPVGNIKNYKVEKTEMKFWTPEEIQKFFKYINKDIEIESTEKKKIAYRTKIFTLICFNLGDRVGETRALTFDCFDNKTSTVKIKHSINYDLKSTDFLSDTKNYQSQRVIDISDKLIKEINKYNLFLKKDCNIDVKDNSIIFFNYETNKPYSDVALRKAFYKYCDEAGVPKIRMYDLRHTYVATMMAEGKDLYLFSKRIGHSSINTTINKYGHLSDKVKKELATSTDKYC